MTDFNSAKRHAFIEGTIEHTQAMLADSRVQCALGDRAVALTEMVDNLFVPNVRDGVPVIPDEYLYTNSYPILAAMPGDHLKLKFLKPTPRQSALAKANLEAIQPSFPTETLVAGLTEVAKEGTHNDVTFATRSTGLCLTGEFQLECVPELFGASSPLVVNKRFISFKARPLIAIQYTDRTYMGFGRNPRPDLLVHELTHAQQSEADAMALVPERPKNYAARRELEAIHVGATLMSAALGGDTLNPQDIVISEAGKALQIEAIRKELANPDDPFAMPARTIKALKEQGLYQHVVQADMLVA